MDSSTKRNIIKKEFGRIGIDSNQLLVQGQFDTALDNLVII